MQQMYVFVWFFKIDLLFRKKRWLDYIKGGPIKTVDFVSCFFVEELLI